MSIAEASPGAPAHVPSRAQRRVLDALADGPGTLAELSVATGSHPNTLREHLAVLVAAGLVTVDSATRGDPRRGRPALRYRRAPLADVASVAAALADEAGRLPNADDFALRAGARWEALAGDGGPQGLLERLEQLGFRPEEVAEGIVLRSCPVAESAAAAPGIVCRMHLGAIQHRWPDEGAVDLVPHDRPDGCLLRLQR